MTAFECPECGADVRVVGAFVPECNLFSGVFLLLAIVALWTFVGLIGGLEFSLNLLRHYGPVDYSISVTLDGAISTRAWSKNPGGAPRLLVNSDMKLTGRIWDRKPLALSVVHFVLEPEFKDVSERPKVYLRYDLVSDELSWSNNSGTGGAIDDIRINEKLARQWLLLMVESPSDHQVTIVAKGVEHCVRHTVKSVRSHEKGKRVLGGGGGKQASSSSRGNYSIDSKVEYRWDGANPQSWQGIIQVMVFAIWLIGIAIILRIAFRRPKTD